MNQILFLDISPESEINFKLIDEITSKLIYQYNIQEQLEIAKMH